jgi:hypothetical protein
MKNTHAQSAYRLKLVLLFYLVNSSVSFAQTVFFVQDYSGGGPFSGTPPTNGQFDAFVTTKPNSTIKFGPGYMQMERVLPGPEGGGLARAIRATAFSPAPQTLYYQVTMDVKEITGEALNAIYFYVGEGLSVSNSSFPNNSSLFARFSVHFDLSGTEYSYRIRDFNTTATSPSFTGAVTLTWVLNNSSENQIYKMPENAAVASETVLAGRYDLWVNGIKYFAGKTSEPPYSPNKLTNFEIRFRDGYGTVWFTNLSIRDIDIILPAELVQFSGKGENGSVELNWQTSYEQRTKEFVLQRSGDLQTYEDVGVVPAVGDSAGSTQYYFSDRFPLPGINYYRLMKIDADGSVEYSKVVDIVVREDLPEIQISPNPAMPNLIRLRNFMGDIVYLRLVSVLGQEIAFEARPTSGLNELELIPDRKLSSGIYLLLSNQGGLRRCTRVLIE